MNISDNELLAGQLLPCTRLF